MTTEQKKQAGKPEAKFTNTVTITARKGPGYYVFVAKKALENHNEIELHALGLAMSVCISAADQLMKFGYAKLKKTIVETIEGERSGLKPKIRIVLERAADFKKLMDKA